MGTLVGSVMTSRRAWDLIHAFEYVAEHVVSREVVQKLLGHAMFFLNNQPWWNECFSPFI